MGLLALYGCLPGYSFLDAKEKSPVENTFLRLHSPVDRTLGNLAPKAFSGDQFHQQHQILREKEDFLKKIGGLPKPTRTTEVLIIGGGISGLATAYQLRAKKPMVLEQAGRFGGNAQGQAWSYIEYPIGAAYIIQPEKDSEIFKILKEIGATEKWTVRSEEGVPVLNGTPIPHFWKGDSDPKNRGKFKKVEEYFRSFLSEKGREFPDYPTRDEKMRKYLNKLDQITFKDQIIKETGPLHPHVATLIEHYCFSSFGGSMKELSAAAGINFFAAEFEKVCVFPAGNACIAELLLKELHRSLPKNHLMAGQIVFDVRMEGSGVLVSSVDAPGKVSSILADKVVMSCPKFIASVLIDQLDKIDKQKSEAIDKLTYRAYLVANLLVNKKLNLKDYDTFLLGNGKADLKGTEEYAKKIKATDVVNANFASPSGQYSVLSLFRAFPYNGIRDELIEKSSYEKFYREFSEQIHSELLPYFKLDKSNLVDLRLARWGHALPLAQKGLLANETVDHLCRPIKNKIFFVEQDNWALPAFETSMTEAIYWSSVIGK